MSATLTFLALFLAVTSQQSFVDTAPINEGGSVQDGISQHQDSSVKELESLKHSLDKTLAMMKTQSEDFRENNGRTEAHAEKTAEVSENGRLVGKVDQHVDFGRNSDGKPSTKIRTNVDIPSQGIHKSVVHQLAPEYGRTENGNRRSTTIDAPETGNNVDASVQYSPLDMAEYVFWTGDEKGVTLAIEEFLQEGLMSREEAILFLQEIKYNLDYLKNHYTQLGLNSREHSRNQETAFKYPSYAKNEVLKPELQTTFDLSQLQQEVNKKRQPETTHSSQMPSKTSETSEDYDELLERLKVADSLYTEYSLEEVIYQLAKVMFTQSLTRGSAEAQQALQKFTNFLELEADEGHISQALEKKVLDVLIAALSDTLSEHPELVAEARAGLVLPEEHASQLHPFLRQMLDNGDDKATTSGFLASNYKNRHQLNRDALLKEMKIVNRVPLGLGKYKNP